ncbi:MAG: phage baseplate assembly protein domain-containing protein [Methylophilus sp.]
MIGQIWNRLQLMVAQGAGVLIGTHKIQIKVLDNEVLDNVDRIQPYGFSYKPKSGCQAYTVFPSGDRSHGLCIVQGDRRYTLDLLDGEVALHDDQGQKVHLKRDGILINTPFNFEVRADKIKLHAASEYAFDVNGQGQKWDGEGVTKWQDNDVPRPHYNHQPPEI